VSSQTEDSTTLKEEDSSCTGLTKNPDISYSDDKRSITIDLDKGDWFWLAVCVVTIYAATSLMGAL
jgi:hypothetical protein